MTGWNDRPPRLRRRVRRIAVTLALAGGVVALAGCGSSSGGTTSTGDSAAEGGKDPILIGISAAKTGFMSGFDLQAGQLLEMRVKEINAAGGVDGRPLEVKWLDTKSDKATAATNTQLLIQDGANAIVATCDFDFGSGSVLQAVAKKIPALFICADTFKAVDPSLVGDYGAAMGLGTDAAGTVMAEWLRAKKPALKSAYILKDTSVFYSQNNADNFTARWKELGGQVCGEDTFAGSPKLDLSSTITRLRGKVSGCDLIYDASYNPYGAQVIRAVRDAGIDLPIATSDGVGGTAIKDIAGGASDVYSPAFACDPTYCEGSQTSEVRRINADFKKAYGQDVAFHFSLPGYVIPDLIANAVKQAGGTDGTKMAEAMLSSPVPYLGKTLKFTSGCHRPQPATFSIEQYTDGTAKQIDERAAEKIPDLGDGNPCAGSEK